MASLDEVTEKFRRDHAAPIIKGENTPAGDTSRLTSRYLDPLWADLVKSSPELALQLLKVIGLREGEAGARLAVSLEQLGLRGAINEFLRGWIPVDPAAAWRWRTKNLRAGISSAGLVAETVAAGGSPALADIVTGLAPSNAKNALVAELAARWSEADRVAARDWIESLQGGTDPRAVDVALIGFTTAWAKASPGEAAQWATEQLPPGSLRAEALSAVVGQWITDGGVKEAAAWLAPRLPDTDSDVAVLQVARALIPGNIPDSIAWARRGTNPTNVDLVLSAGVRDYYTTEPAAAILFAQEMSDGRMRKNAVERTLSQWAIIAPTSMETFVRGASKLTDTEKSFAASLKPKK